jgi:hypothetical protein
MNLVGEGGGRTRGLGFREGGTLWYRTTDTVGTLRHSRYVREDIAVGRTSDSLKYVGPGATTTYLRKCPAGRIRTAYGICLS